MIDNINWERKLQRENPDFFKALCEQYRFCLDNNIEVNKNGRYETPKDDLTVNIKGDKLWLKFNIRCKGGNRIRINSFNIDSEKNDFRNVISAYVTYLRLDGVSNKDEMLYYVIHFIFYNISFANYLEVSYNKTKPLIDNLIDWILQKDISKIEIKENIIDKRKVVAPKLKNIEGRDFKMSKSDKIKEAQKHRKILTDKMIAEKFNPYLTDKENCEIIGVKIRRLQQWKKQERENGETKNKLEKIKELYNPNLSLKKNCEVIGVGSVNTLKKYLKEINKKDNKVLEESYSNDTSWIDDLLSA